MNLTVMGAVVAIELLVGAVLGLLIPTEKDLEYIRARDLLFRLQLRVQPLVLSHVGDQLRIVAILLTRRCQAID